MNEYLVGITRDLLDSRGQPTFGTAPLGLLDEAPGITWEYLADLPAELTPDHMARYDALYINAPRVTRASFGTGGRPRTRIIARHGVGYDSVDVAACTANGVILTNQPDGVRRPVAVMAITYVLVLSQKLMAKSRIARTKGWAGRLDQMGVGLVGRTLGLVGAGNIGREIIRLARPFDLRVLAADPYVDPALVTALGASLVDLDRVLRESDFVVVICLLNETTRHLIGARELSLMRPSAYLINVARGPIVDEAALIAALREGRIAGAGLDVFEQEPTDPANPLLSMENVVATPHAHCWTDQCFRDLAEGGLTGILAALRGGRPRNVVNPEVLDRSGA
jgi:D-3-phosphoglycerate dehydrogenase